MFPARAADADREIALHLFPISRQRVRDKVEKLSIELFVSRLRLQVFDDLRIESGLRTQRFDKVRVRKESHVEQQVEVIGQAVFESERDDRDEQRLFRAGDLEPPHDLGLQLVHGKLRRVERQV